MDGIVNTYFYNGASYVGYSKELEGKMTDEDAKRYGILNYVVNMLSNNFDYLKDKDFCMEFYSTYDEVNKDFMRLINKPAIEDLYDENVYISSGLSIKDLSDILGLIWFRIDWLKLHEWNDRSKTYELILDIEKGGS